MTIAIHGNANIFMVVYNATKLGFSALYGNLQSTGLICESISINIDLSWETYFTDASFSAVSSQLLS